MNAMKTAKWPAEENVNEIMNAMKTAKWPAEVQKIMKTTMSTMFTKDTCVLTWDSSLKWALKRVIAPR